MTERRFLLAIDQGTTGSTALIIDAVDPQQLKIIAKANREFPQHYPQSGWVEHDLNEIWTSVGKAVEDAKLEAMRTSPRFDEKAIVAIGITNQRETLCTFNCRSSEPLCRAIVWQCRRSTDICAYLKGAKMEKIVREKTGLVLDPYFSGTKIHWLMDNDPHVAAAVRSGRAVFGTIDTYLVNRLSGGEAFVTEASNASRTLLYNIERGEWDDELLAAMKVPQRSALPAVQDSASLFGKTKGCGFLPDGIPITGMLGDQQAALAGQACFKPGEGKCTYGTGAFLLFNLGDKPISSKSGLLTTIAWSFNGKRTYCLEGSAFIAGAAVQFLRDQFGFIKGASETEMLARPERAAPEIYFVPALAGLGAPHWNPEARGAFLGLTRGTTKAQMVRAALEAIALSVYDLTEAMTNDRGGPLEVLRVDGGAAANDLLMQCQADFSNVTVDRPAVIETTAFGAALAAGLGVGLYPSLEALTSVRKSEKLFHPHREKAAQSMRTEQLAGWKRAVRAVSVFSPEKVLRTAAS